MIVKVCGMRNPENILGVIELGVNWIGFIFYEKSVRYFGNNHISMLSGYSFKKTGVFVNATYEQILQTTATYQLDYIQLHGDETPEFCSKLQKQGIAIIKAFSVSTAKDLAKVSGYEGSADYFLFDTKCETYGGSGKSFDWSILSAYEGKTPFLLSGGINSQSIQAINNFHHPQLAGIDLNSGFEIEPGLKDIQKLSDFLNKLQLKS